MLEKEPQEVKSQNFKPDKDDFKKAFKICQTIFYNEIYYNNKFNAIVYNSIENTVRVVIDKYGIEAILYLEYLATDKYSKHYGKQAFHPSDFLDIIESSSSEIEKFKLNLKNKNNKSDSASALIPKLHENKRAIPNVFLRSALFGIIKKGNRDFVRDLKIKSLSQYEVFYTGEQLDQNDLVVWDTLTHLIKEKFIDSELKTSMYELCNNMNYSHNKSNRERIKTRINRLQLGQIKIKFGKGLYIGSLIDDCCINELNGKMSIRLNSRFLSLFSTNDYTLTNKKIKGELGENQLALWLFNFYETHQNPIPYSVEYLKELSRSETEQKEFNRMLKNSLTMIKNSYNQNEKNSIFDYNIKNNFLHVIKSHAPKNL